MMGDYILEYRIYRYVYRKEIFFNPILKKNWGGRGSMWVEGKRDIKTFGKHCPRVQNTTEV